MTWFASEPTQLGWILWSSDSKALSFITDNGHRALWCRIAVGENTPTEITRIPDERTYMWSTLAPDGAILYTRNLSTWEIFALRLSER